jgi:predicted RNA-binding Zn-ribbon protein involved in translation (DUF1610 family)
MRTKNLQYKFLGGILIIAGVLLINNPKWYSSKYSMVLDFTEIKWPLGLAMSFVGFWALVNSFTSKFESFICPKCENVLERNLKNPGVCQSCGEELKKLEGYFQKKSINKNTNGTKTNGAN